MTEHYYTTILPGQRIVFKPEHDYMYEGHVVSHDLAAQQVIADVRQIRASYVERDVVRKVERKTFHHRDIDQIEGRFNLNRLYNVNGTHPQTKIMVKVGQSHQQDGRDEAQMLWESLNFIAAIAWRERENLVKVYVSQAFESADQVLRLSGSAAVGTMAIQMLGNAVAHEPEAGNEFAAVFHRQHALTHKLAMLNPEIISSYLNDTGREALADYLK